jgi:tripartite-type tricarboxylate transporter receptor subunit TctC
VAICTGSGYTFCVTACETHANLKASRLMPKFSCLPLTLAAAIVALPSIGFADLSAECSGKLADKRLLVIVPNAAGGGYDTYGRALAPVFEQVAGLRADVVNMPGAGGLVALTRLTTSGPEDLVVMVENINDVLRSELAEGAEPWIEKVKILGVFHNEPSAWLGRPGTSLGTPGTKFVAAAASSDSLVEFKLGGQAIGLNIEMISGYGGSKETEAALLRGEADLASNSLTTSLKGAASGDLEILMLLSDKPNPRAPGVPHLAGEDGLAAEYAKTLPAEDRALHIERAGLAADLSFDIRAIFSSATMRPDLQACLGEAAQEVIFSDAFRDAAEKQGRPVTPMPADEVTALLGRFATLQSRLQDWQESDAAKQ